LRKRYANYGESEETDPAIVHYEDVLRENCKRLLSSTALSCKQAGAIFRLNGKWIDNEHEDVAGRWLTLKNKVILLGLASIGDYHPFVWKQLEDGCSNQDTFAIGADEKPNTFGNRTVIIEPEPFYDGTVPLYTNPETNTCSGTFPNPDLTHLILTDNMPLLEEKLNEMAPWGLILLNGDHNSGKLFVQAIQESLPVVIFKHTGYTGIIILSVSFYFIIVLNSFIRVYDII
jgi:hypothetical protein